jgi:hypothetical protein
LPFFTASYYHNPRAQPVVLGLIHRESKVEAAGSSLTYIKTQRDSAENEELEFRRNFLGSLLAYDSKIQTFLNGDRGKKIELTNEERAMRLIFRSWNWCVFRCRWEIEKDHPNHWEPECKRQVSLHLDLANRIL